MENLTYYILGLYVLPMILNILFVYSDDQVRTIGDLMIKNWWFYFTPVFNLLMCLLIPLYYISVFFDKKLKGRLDKFKNMKIK